MSKFSVYALEATASGDYDLLIYDSSEGLAANQVKRIGVDTILAGSLDAEFGELRLNAATELTISSGAVTATQSSHKLQPESGTTDDLDTINGGTDGMLIVLHASDAGTDTITIKHGTGNISCFGASDLSLSEGAVLAYYDGTEWKALGGGGGGTDTFATVFDFRLTLETGVPVSTSDQTAKTTVYLAFYKGNRALLYTGSAWAIVELASELSVSVPANTNTPFDVFLDYNGGTPQLVATAWTNDTTRATAITRQDGRYVKSGDAQQLYVGTGRTTGVSGQCEDSKSRRLLWNYYNRVVRHMYINYAATHTYTTAAYRAWNANTTPGQARFDLVVGVAEVELLNWWNNRVAGTSSGSGIYGTALDSTTLINNQLSLSGWAGETLFFASFVNLGGLSAGYHFVSMNQYGAATSIQYQTMTVWAMLEG